jgi:20S proteasome alpha/beta subunit
MLLQVPCPISASSPSWKSAPWQANDESLLERLRYNELSPTVFSPTGRLHPVERVMEEVRDLQSNLVVSLCCQDGILMLSTVLLSPHLNTTIPQWIDDDNHHHNHNNNNQTIIGISSLIVETSSEETNTNDTTPILELGPGVVGATAGKPGDSQVLRMRLEAMALQLVEDDLDDHVLSKVSVPRLARQMADLLQGPTQTTNGRQGPLLSVRTKHSLGAPHTAVS